MKNGICSCGMPQSYPIPHIHDLSERELQIYLAQENKIKAITGELFAIYQRNKVSDTSCIHSATKEAFCEEMIKFFQRIEISGNVN